MHPRQKSLIIIEWTPLEPQIDTRTWSYEINWHVYNTFPFQNPFLSMSYIIYNGFYDLYAIIKTNERNNLIKVSSKAMFEPQTNQKLSSYTKIQIFYSRISWFTDLRAKYLNFWVKLGVISSWFEARTWPWMILLWDYSVSDNWNGDSFGSLNGLQLR